MATFRLNIVTPEKLAFNEEVEAVDLPGAQGVLQILPGHQPLMTLIVAGELVVRRTDGILELAVGEGMVEITNERVVVLTSMALEAAEIDESAAEEAIRRAKAALAEKNSGPDEEALQAMIQCNMAKLKLKRKHQH